jgi:SAM-dependent methyltransferase
VKKLWQDILDPYLGSECLNIGCGFNPEPSTEKSHFTNLDYNENGPADVIHDLRSLPLPFEDNKFDTVFASHVLEHLEQDMLIDVVYDISRILKVGGHLIAIVPYGTHDSAWDNPHHRQLFSQTTWNYFDRRLYEVPNTSGTGAGQRHRYAVWSKPYISLTPEERYQSLSAEELNALLLREKNVITEMQVVLKLEEK